METPQKQAKPDKITYFELNSKVNIPKDGKIQLDKDREAVKAYFKEYVNPNLMYFKEGLEEKIEYLVENDYIEQEFLDKYDFKFIKKLFKKLYNKKFRFKSFMGAYKFYTQYAMKTDDKKRILELYEDRIAFTALYLADGDMELAENIAIEIIEQRFTPATPTFLNAGKKRRGEMVSCFLIDLDDSMLSIGRGINSSLQLSRGGGGVGVNVSNLREAGSTIKGIENASSGVVPVMKLLEDSFSYSNQLGQRNGAGVAYLSVFHPDILDFLSTKKENADEKVRLKTLSLGVIVPDKYYELLRTNEDMYLFSPKDVEDEYGEPFSYVDITKEYDNLVANDNVKKYKYNARKLEHEISKLQQESGYPYVINIDTANKENPVYGTVIMSNLCVAPTTKILTDKGYQEIQTLEGKEVNVWNGEEWSSVTVKKTGENQELLKVKTDSGYELESTPYHKYYVLKENASDNDPEYKEVRASELKVGDKLIKFDLPVVEGEKELEYAYDNGCFTGDGSTNGLFKRKRPNDDNSKLIYLLGDRKKLAKHLESVKEFKHHKIMTTGVAHNLKDRYFVPDQNYTVNTRLKWLAGYMDIAGQVVITKDSQNVQTKSLNKEFLREVQLMLQTLGVHSKVEPYKKYPTKEFYRLLINDNSLFKLKELGLECNRLEGIDKPSKENSQFIKVESVESVDGLHDTYCFSEPKRHMGMFNGILTGQCSEILQVQSPSELNADLSYEKVGHDISCNLGSTVIQNLIHAKDFGKSVDTMVRALTSVTDKTSIEEVPTVKKANEDYRSIGLGAMGLHTALATNKIHYGSQESLEFTDLYFRALRYHALKSSNQIAKERNETFYEFDKSAYADGSYIQDKYIEEDELDIKSGKVKDLFKDIYIPTKQDWKELSKEIQEHGLYHSYLLAIAPTGSISYITESSASLQPINQLIENRQEKKTGSIYYPAPGLDNETIDYYKSAYDTDMRKQIDIYATAQKHIDQGMSLTLFMRSEIPEGLYEWKNGKSDKLTTRDLNKLRNYAWTKGIKSLYYVRTYTDDGDIVGANSCESCIV